MRPYQRNYNSNIRNTETVHVVCGEATLIGMMQCALQFYIHGTVHRNSVLIKSNKMQQYAGIYLLQNHSICLGVHRTHHLEYIKL